MEFYILDLIQNHKTHFLDYLMPKITMLGNLGMIWIILCIILICKKNTRRSGIILLIIIIIDIFICNIFLKNIIARTRPFDINTNINLLISRPKDFSFPSGHTAISFASTLSLYLSGMKKMSLCALLLAILIAFSRLYLYVHFPSDIIGGIFIGLISAIIGYNIFKYFETKKVL